MLNLHNIKCQLGGVNILNIDTLEIKRPGLYAFVGPSGCGKTTLLNIIAGLNREYSGKMTIFNRAYKRLDEEDIVRFRSSHLSIFFQHSVFIEQLTLQENVSLTHLVHTPSLVKFSETMNSNILQALNIEALSKQRVKTLSGGEKTRAALARTLSKESPLYLFDEPTAALDQSNAQNVMNIISTKAERSIVLLVTHDLNIARKYAHYIFTMQDGQITKTKVNKSLPKAAHKIVPKVIDYTKNDSFIAKALLKARKVRHIVTGGAVNIGLVGLGLSLLLVNAVNSKLVSAFKGVFNEHTTYVESTYTPTINVIKSASSQALSALSSENEVGAIYLNDMFSMFPSQNTLSFYERGFKFTLPSFHAGLFNEALFLSEITADLYPYINTLASDEIGLILPFDDYKLLQNALRLPFRNSPVDVGNYLRQNNLTLILELGNAYWDYFDEQSFTLKTVLLGQEPQVIFGKPNDVIHLFETKMRFPSSLNLTKIEEYPWTLKRLNFIYTHEYEALLWSTLNYPDYLFTLANRDYFRYIFTSKHLNRRILAFETPPYFNNILTLETSEITQGFLTFTNGLIFVPELMLLGYTHNFFIASDARLIEDVIQVDELEKEKISAAFTLPTGIMNLAIQYNGFGSFNYAASIKEYKLSEVAISSALALKLFGSSDVIGSALHIGTLTSIVEMNNEYIKAYTTTTLTIVDVIENDEVVIYQHPLWNYLLFKDIFHVSVFNLHLNGLIYEGPIDSVDADNWLFKTSRPYQLFVETINKTLKEIELLTMVIAAGALLLSAVIIFMIIYLLVAETNEEFSALYLIGYTKEAMQSVVRNYIFRFLGFIIALAIGQLFIFSFIIEFLLNAYLKTRFSYVFNLKPYIFTLFFAGGLLLVLLGFFTKKMAKINLLQFSKRDL